MRSVSSPAELAKRLHLGPSEAQYAAWDQLMAGQPVTDLRELENGGTMRAVALWMLWRLLSNISSSATIIAPTKKAGEEFMTFLHKVTMMLDPALASICRWNGYRTLKINAVENGEARLISNHPALMYGRHPSRHHTFVVLGAEVTEISFGKMREALTTMLGGSWKVEGVQKVRLWS